MSDNTPGWQPDPTGRHEHRYWDGTRWTDHVADAGASDTDAYTEGAGAEGPTEGAGADAPAPDAPGAADGGDATVVGANPPSDPTASWPAAAAAAPPPPYEAPGAPIPPGPPAASSGQADNASSGSKKGLLIGGGILVIVALFAAFLLFGGDDDGDGDSERIRTGLASAINDEGQLSDEQASCLADHMVDEIGEDRLADVDFTADDPPADLEDEFTAAALSGVEGCDISMSELAGGEDTDGSTTDDTTTDDTTTDDTTTDDTTTDDTTSDDDSADGGFGTDTAVFDEEFESMLADIYADSFGISRDKAECLAGKISDAMESGELTEEQMMDDIFSYFSDCDIEMSEISGN